MTEWVIRPAVPDDLNFIYDSWIDTVREKSPLRLSTTSSLFKKEYLKIVDHLLEKSHAVVATVPESAFLIMGYGVFEENKLHMIYVKHIFRRLGIGRNLYDHMGRPRTVTHCTNPYGRAILENHPEITYNPFILFERGEIHGEAENTCEDSSSLLRVGSYRV